MEILQLPIMALQERIEHELQENPVLELKEPGTEQEAKAAPPIRSSTSNRPRPEEPRDVDPEKELVIDDKGDNEQDFDRLIAINEDWADHFNEEHRPSSNRISEEMRQEARRHGATWRPVRNRCKITSTISSPSSTAPDDEIDSPAAPHRPHRRKRLPAHPAATEIARAA